MADRSCPGAGSRSAPAVYRDMSQAELDAQYDQRTLVPHAADYMARWSDRSAVLRRTSPPETRNYGDDPLESLDIYPGRPGGPVHVHVHGGAWRLMSRDQAGFVARGLGARGATVAVLGFGLAPDVTLSRMVDQVRRGFLHVLSLASGSAGPSPAIEVSGHSSGAHLAACLLDGAWQSRAGLPAAAIGRVLLASGLYDLEPVRLSARNAYLDLTPDDVAALSPVRHSHRPGPAVTVVWGEGELAEFKRQSTEFAARLRDRGLDVTGGEIPGRNHFDIYDDFGEPGSAVLANGAAPMI